MSLGLTEEITVGLARFRWIACVPTTSLLHSMDHGPAGSAVAEHRDLDFLLEGTVQTNAHRVRVIARLVDMHAAGEVVWTRRFDRDAGDILRLQDEIASEAVAQLDPELLLREGARASSNPHRDPNAQNLLLQAIPAIYRFERTGFQAARGILERSLALDPSNASTHAWLAYWHLFQVGQGWTETPTENALCAAELAERAVILDPADGRAMTLAGHVQSFLSKRPHQGRILHDRALSLNPNLALAWCFSGLAHCYLGNQHEAARRIAIAQRLSPHDPHGFFFDMAQTMPNLLSGNFDAAAEIGRRAIELNPDFSSSYKGHLAALGYLGRHQEAAEARTRLLMLEPEFSLHSAMTRSPMARACDQEIYIEGLRRAGLK